MIRERIARTDFRQRVVLLSAAAVAAAVLLASGILFLVVRSELRGRVDGELRNLVRDIAVSGRLPSVPSAQESEVFVLPRDPLGGPAGYAQVIQPDGSVIPPRGERIELPVDRRTLDVAAGRADPFFSDETLNGMHARVYTTRLPGGVTVQAVRGLDEVDRSLRNLAIALAIVSLGGIALAVWLGRLVARAALTPVTRLTEAAEHVAETRDLSRRIATGGGDELGRLASTFNAMLAALERSQKAQRQLVADASHELRTPLTSLRTNMEVLSEADSLPREDRERLLRDVRAQLEELTVLMTDLVDLARGDEPEPAAEDVRLDLLAAEAVERARRYSPDREFTADLEPSLVRGVPARLDRAVSNLLDNAAKWSAPGGEIDVQVRSGELSVRDRGPGIAPSDLPFIFDRFYRAPAARGLPGSGLGLAIVRQIVEAHGGRVSAETPRGGGALLRMRLPELPHAVPDEPVAPAADRAIEAQAARR